MRHLRGQALYTDEDYEDKTDAERQRTRAELDRVLPEMAGLPVYGQIVRGRMWPILHQLSAERAQEEELAKVMKVTRPKEASVMKYPSRLGLPRPVQEREEPEDQAPEVPDEDLLELYNLL